MDKGSIENRGSGSLIVIVLYILLAILFTNTFRY